MNLTNNTLGIKPEQAADASLSSAPQARKFLANAVPWAEDGQEAYVNIHTSFTGIDRHKGQEKTFWTGRACKTLDETINYIEWSLRQPNTLGMYCCMSSQSQCEIKTSAKGHEIRRAVRLQENAVTLKSLFIDLDFKDYNSPDEAVVALGKFITKVDMPKPSVLVKTALALFWPGSQRWSPTSRELANRQLGLSLS